MQTTRNSRHLTEQRVRQIHADLRLDYLQHLSEQAATPVDTTNTNNSVAVAAGKAGGRNNSKSASVRARGKWNIAKVKLAAKRAFEEGGARAHMRRAVGAKCYTKVLASRLASGVGLAIEAQENAKKANDERAEVWRSVFHRPEGRDTKLADMEVVRALVDATTRSHANKLSPWAESPPRGQPVCLPRVLSRYAFPPSPPPAADGGPHGSAGTASRARVARQQHASSPRARRVKRPPLEIVCVCIMPQNNGNRNEAAAPPRATCSSTRHPASRALVKQRVLEEVRLTRGNNETVAPPRATPRHLKSRTGLVDATKRSHANKLSPWDQYD